MSCGGFTVNGEYEDDGCYGYCGGARDCESCGESYITCYGHECGEIKGDGLDAKKRLDTQTQTL